MLFDYSLVIPQIKSLNDNDKDDNSNLLNYDYYNNDKHSKFEFDMVACKIKCTRNTCSSAAYILSYPILYPNLNPEYKTAYPKIIQSIGWVVTPGLPQVFVLISMYGSH